MTATDPDSRQRLRERITVAFEGVPRPGDSHIVGQTFYDEGVGAWFSTHERDQMSPEALTLRFHALWFLTIPALHYYLPAFMLAALDGADILWGAIAEQLAGRIDSERTRQLVRILDAEQRQCLRDFLEYGWRLENPAEVDSHLDAVYSAAMENVSRTR